MDAPTQPTSPHDDRSLRTPLARVLFSLSAMNAAQLERAAAALSHQGGLFATRLVESGVGSAEVVTALAQVSGLTPAPVAALRQPDSSLAVEPDPKTWLRLLAAPFGREGDTLLVAFANPLAAQLPEAAELPPHLPYVALEVEVRRCLLALHGPERLGLPYVPRTPRPPDPPLASAPLTPMPPPEAFSTLGPSTFENQYQEVGGYTLLKPLSPSALGDVYLARDGSGPEVTLELLPAEQSALPAFASHFRKVGEQVLALRHANIAPLVDFGDDGGRAYFVRERTPGSASVTELVARMGRLPAPLAAELFAQLLAALDFAHGHGMTHGALSPESLTIGEDGQLRVGGFGDGALLSAIGRSPSGPAARYVSPERTADARSDLYSAGLVLLHLLTGAELPAQGAPPLVFELEPSVPSALENLVERLLSAVPAQRFESATQVLAELRTYLDEQRELYPLLVTATLGNPDRMQQQMRKDQAKAYLSEARALLDKGGRRNQVAMTLYKATLLEPGETVAAQGFAAICQADRLQFGPSKNPRIRELEEKVAAQPDASATLQQLAQLYRAEGNIFRALVCLKKDLRNRPNDAQLLAQMSQLLESRMGPQSPVTREIVRPEAPRTTEVTIQRPVDPAEERKRAAQARGRKVVMAALIFAFLLASLVALEWRLRLGSG